MINAETQQIYYQVPGKDNIMKTLLNKSHTTIVLLLFVICGVTEISNQSKAAGNRLTDEEKVYGLSILWKEASYNFAHFDHIPDLDWDKTYQEFILKVLSTKSPEEYYKVLTQFYALLNHHHTRIFPPQEVRESHDEPKVKVVNIQRQAIIADVGESLKNDIPIGSRIIRVDDVPINVYLKKNKFPYICCSTKEFLWEIGLIELLKGKKGTSVSITYVTPKGKNKEIALLRNSKDIEESWVRSDAKKTGFEFNWLENNIAYIALNTFNDNKILRDFKGKLSELQKCRGLIIDLRNNGGGDSDIGYGILKHLIERPIPTYIWKTRENISIYKAWGRWTSELPPDALKEISEERKEYLRHYKGTAFRNGDSDTIYPSKTNRIIVPMVALTGNTGSAAEDFLVAIDSIERAIFVGKTTAGCTGTPFMFDLPGGGMAMVTTTIQMYPDGRRNRNGIKPDIEVLPTVQNIIDDKDAALEKAVEILSNKIKQSSG